MKKKLFVIALFSIVLVSVMGIQPLYVSAEDNTTTSSSKETSSTSLVDAVNNVNKGSFTDSELSMVKNAEKEGIVIRNDDGTYALKQGQEAGAGVWTLFAQLLMDKPETTSDAEDNGKGFDIKHPVSSALGDKGVSVDIPYTYISQYGNDVSKEEYGDDSADKSNGRLLASFLATFSNYGYIETVSGNSIAAGGTNILVGLGRIIGGFVGGVAIAFEAVGSFFNNILATFFSTFNVFKMLGFGNTTPVGAVASAGTKFFESIGLSANTFKVISTFMMTIFTGVFGIQMIRHLSTRGFSGGGFMSALSSWVTRLFVFFVFFPLCGVFLDVITNAHKEYKSDNVSGSSIVSKYIINDRLWASGTNLSPDGLNGTVKFPSASAKENYVDTSYVPSASRNLIAGINKASYETIGETDQSKIGIDLLKQWIANDTFNVNTYAGDIARGHSLDGTLPAYSNEQDLDGKSQIKDLAGYIWSADQSPDDNSKLPNGEARESKIKFSGKSKVGVSDSGSFSTQSVALMLQSSLDSQGAHFYAYNLAPTGAQGTMKNLSTVKTEWRATTLVGAGVTGKLGSWMELVVDSSVSAILMIASGLALLGINIVDATKKFLKNLGLTLLTGELAPATSTMTLAMGMMFTGIIAAETASVVLALCQGVGGAIMSVVDNGFLFDGLFEIVRAVCTGFLCYFLAIRKFKDGETFVTKLVGYPMTVADEINKRTQFLLGNRTGLSRMAYGRNKYGYSNPWNGNGETNTPSSSRDNDGNGEPTNNPENNPETNPLPEEPNHNSKPVDSYSYSISGEDENGNRYTGMATTDSTGRRTYMLNPETSANDLMKNPALLIETDKDGELTNWKNDPNLDDPSRNNTGDENENGQEAPELTEEDMDRLADIEDKDTFASELKGTDAGMELALNTESAKDLLSNTDYIDENGSVDMDKVNNRLEAGNAKDAKMEDWKEVEKINNAFRTGSDEIFTGMSNDGEGALSSSSEFRNEMRKQSRVNTLKNVAINQAKNMQNTFENMPKGSIGGAMYSTVKGAKKATNKVSESSRLKTIEKEKNQQNDLDFAKKMRKRALKEFEQKKYKEKDEHYFKDNTKK